MTAPSLERLGRDWAQAMQHPKVDEQRSLVQFLEVVAQDNARPRRNNASLLLAAASVICMLGVGGYVYRQNQFAQKPVGVENAVAGTWLETRQDQKMPLRFSEGSEVVVSESSRVRVGSVDPRGAEVVVERGSVQASIVHRSDTRWAFAAGPFNVRVTGTVLGVDWRPERHEFSVYVDQGSVVAQGPMFGAGREIRGGESCTVHLASSRLVCSARKRDLAKPASSSGEIADHQEAPEPRASEVPDATELPLVTESNPPPLPRSQSSEPSAGLSKLRALERAGKYAEALSYAESLGVSRLLGTAGPEDLFCLSRLGRYQGKLGLSSEALVKIRSRFAKTKEAHVAAFLLGRQSSANEASNWFRTYLAEEPQGAFAREAEGRLVESLHHAGRSSEAEAAARRYLAAYPSGPHAGFAKSLLAKP